MEFFASYLRYDIPGRAVEIINLRAWKDSSGALEQLIQEGHGDLASRLALDALFCAASANDHTPEVVIPRIKLESLQNYFASTSEDDWGIDSLTAPIVEVSALDRPDLGKTMIDACRQRTKATSPLVEGAADAGVEDVISLTLDATITVGREAQTITNLLAAGIDAEEMMEAINDLDDPETEREWIEHCLKLNRVDLDQAVISILDHVGPLRNDYFDDLFAIARHRESLRAAPALAPPSIMMPP